MTVEEYLAKINVLLEQDGLVAHIIKEEEVQFVNDRSSDFTYYKQRPKFSIDTKIHELSSRQLTGYEEVWRLIHRALTKSSSGVSEIIDANYLKLVGGPKEYDLIYDFIVSFIGSQEQTTFKLVTFSVPVGIVCSIGTGSPKLFELIQKMFCANYNNNYGPTILKANDSCYIRKDMKTQLVAELMEELEKEIE